MPSGTSIQPSTRGNEWLIAMVKRPHYIRNVACAILIGVGADQGVAHERDSPH